MSSKAETPWIEEQIRGFVATNLLYSESGVGYPDDASFLDEGIIDSLGVMELVEFVRGSLGVTVAQSEIVPDNFDSVAKLAAFVRNKRRVEEALP